MSGRYQALVQVGAGGMAQVFVGVQHGVLGATRLVVIKRVRDEIADDQDYLDMFVDEARISVRLSHPNVVRTYDVLANPPALIMEFLDGQSLLAILNTVGRSALPLQEHVWILTQLLAGLQYAHELHDFAGTRLGLVHRDVTPSNVFVCYDGSVKLLDFGIAKVAGAIAATRDGILKGKIGYVSPEQCMGQRASLQSDIFAVGVMLWEAMAGRRRLSGSTLAAQVRARVEGLEPPIERVWPQAPPALVAIVRRALQLEPSRRYPSARSMQRDLEAYLASVRSAAGASSVSLVIRNHFQRERADLHRAIREHLEGTSVRSLENKQVPELVAGAQRPLVGPPLVPLPGEPTDQAGLEALSGKSPTGVFGIRWGIAAVHLKTRWQALWPVLWAACERVRVSSQAHRAVAFAALLVGSFLASRAAPILAPRDLSGAAPIGEQRSARGEAITPPMDRFPAQTAVDSVMAECSPLDGPDIADVVEAPASVGADLPVAAVGGHAELGRCAPGRVDGLADAPGHSTRAPTSAAKDVAVGPGMDLRILSRSATVRAINEQSPYLP